MSRRRYDRDLIINTGRNPALHDIADLANATGYALDWTFKRQVRYLIGDGALAARFDHDGPQR